MNITSAADVHTHAVSPALILKPVPSRTSHARTSHARELAVRLPQQSCNCVSAFFRDCVGLMTARRRGPRSPKPRRIASRGPRPGRTRVAIRSRYGARRSSPARADSSQPAPPTRPRAGRPHRGGGAETLSERRGSARCPRCLLRSPLDSTATKSALFSVTMQRPSSCANTNSCSSCRPRNSGASCAATASRPRRRSPSAIAAENISSRRSFTRTGVDALHRRAASRRPRLRSSRRGRRSRPGTTRNSSPRCAPALR